MNYRREYLRQSEFLAINQDYREAYDGLCVAVRWMRQCQKASFATEDPADWRAARVSEAEVDRLLR